MPGVFPPFSRCRRFSPPDQDLFGWTCRSTVLPGPPCQIVASPVKSRRATELSSVRARSSESVDVAPDRPPPRLYGIALVLCVPFLLCRIASAAIARRERIPAATMESRRKKAERITSAAARWKQEERESRGFPCRSRTRRRGGSCGRGAAAVDSARSPESLSSPPGRRRSHARQTLNPRVLDREHHRTMAMVNSGSPRESINRCSMNYSPELPSAVMSPCAAGRIQSALNPWR
jgi:hypothetical protein